MLMPREHVWGHWGCAIFYITNLRNHCGVRRISDNLPERVRRVTVASQHRKESNADAVRRCTQNTLMLPCGSKTVDHARTRIASIESQAEPRPSHHPRVLRASSRYICVEILDSRCRGPMLAHPLPGPRRRTRFWRYTLAQRVYGARFGCGQRLRCV
jgi:hypothetical protein